MSASPEPAENTAYDYEWFAAQPGWPHEQLFDLWRYRELVLEFALRNIRIRYRQAVIGVFWVIFQPVGTVLVFQLLFGLLGRIPAGQNANYPLSAFIGVLVWQFMSLSLKDASDVLIQNQQLVTKIYFPRAVLPTSCLLTSLLDFCIGLCVFAAMMAWYRMPPGWQLIQSLAFLMLGMVLVFGLSLFTASLTALYRDVRYALPFLLQLLFYLSPAVYETNALIPEKWQAVYALNPFGTVIEGIRSGVLQTPTPSSFAILWLILMAACALLGGMFFLNHMEQQVADRI